MGWFRVRDTMKQRCYKCSEWVNSIEFSDEFFQCYRCGNIQRNKYWNGVRLGNSGVG